MEYPKAEKVVLNSGDRYCFAISKFLSLDYMWMAEGFGAAFYIEWKKRKDQNAKSQGKLGLGPLESLVKSATGAFNKMNSYTPLTFQELRGAYDILCDGIGIGTVLRRGQMTGDLLLEARVVKGNGTLCEYIADTQGTILKRFVYRAVGNDPKFALETLRTCGIFASGVDDGTVVRKHAGGIAFKEIAAQKKQKGVTRMKSEHVMGWKPSIFISFTTLGSGASNPKGDAFGKVSVQIDLKVLKDQGIPFTFLGSLEGVRFLAVELKGKQGASQQAFADIVRTKEILVEGWVPPEAICQIKDDKEVVWSRPL